MSKSTFGIHKILRHYLKDGMCWPDKKTTPIVVIHNYFKSGFDYIVFIFIRSDN